MPNSKTFIVQEQETNNAKKNYRVCFTEQEKILPVLQYFDLKSNIYHLLLIFAILSKKNRVFGEYF